MTTIPTWQLVLYGISSQWEFLPAWLLSIVAVWGRTRWSKPAVVGAFLTMCAAFTAAGAWCGLTGHGIRPTFMTLMCVLIPLYWRLSGLTFLRSLFIASTSLIPMMLCIDVSVIVDNNFVLPQERGIAFVGLVGAVTQWVLAAVLIAACWRPMRRALPRIVDSPALPDRLWTVAWLMPFISVSMITVFTPQPDDVARDRAQTWLYLTMAVLFAILCALVYALLWGVVVQSERNMAVSEANRRLEMRRMQQEHLEGRIAAAQRARHDLRQHLVAIRAMVDKSDGAGLKAYLDGLDVSIGAETSSRIRYCDHLAVNSIVVYYADLARATGASIDVRMDIPARVAIPDADLSVVFGNLLENAVDALAAMPPSMVGQGRLSVRASCAARGTLFLEIANTCASPVPDLDAAAVAGAKHPGDGLGIQSVRALAAERGGELRYDIAADADTGADTRPITVTARLALPPVVA